MHAKTPIVIFANLQQRDDRLHDLQSVSDGLNVV